MTPAEVLALLQLLDALFELEGRLVAAAQQTHPELRADPLPGLEEVDAAREDAVRRASFEVPLTPRGVS